MALFVWPVCFLLYTLMMWFLMADTLTPSSMFLPLPLASAPKLITDWRTKSDRRDLALTVLPSKTSEGSKGGGAEGFLGAEPFLDFLSIDRGDCFMSESLPLPYTAFSLALFLHFVLLLALVWGGFQQPSSVSLSLSAKWRTLALFLELRLDLAAASSGKWSSSSLEEYDVSPPPSTWPIPTVYALNQS